MAEKQCNLLKNGGGMEQYSTSEQIVGIWVDGKTRYRQEYHGTVSSSGATQVSISVPSIDTLIKYEDAYIDNRGSLSKAYYWSASDYFRTYIENGKLTVNVGSSYPQAPLRYVVIIEYTKQ